MSEKPSLEKLPLGERPPVRMVGDAPEPVKELVSEHLASRLGEGHLDQLTEAQINALKSSEYEKRSYEKEAIAIANELTNQILEQSGVQPFDIPEQNVHIVPLELFNTFRGDSSSTSSSVIATTYSNRYLIISNGAEMRQKVTDGISTLFHEITHGKGYMAQELFESKNKKNEYGFATHRSGIRVDSTSKKSRGRDLSFTVFRGLNEGFVSLLEKNNFRMLLQKITAPDIQDEISWMEGEGAKELMQEISRKEDRPPDEISWLSRDGKAYRFFPYYDQRRVLDFIIKSAVEDNSISSYEEGMGIFAKAHFRGNIVDLAKLVEATFGKETFGWLGLMNDDNSARFILDRLQKKRRLLLAKRKKESDSKVEVGDEG